MAMKVKKEGLSNRMFYAFNTVFWIVILVVLLYPLYYVVIASVSDPDMVARGKVFLYPIGFSLEGYQAVLRYKALMSSYLNSLIYTVVSVTISIFITLGAAYTLSLPKLKGKAFLNFFFVFTMFFSGGLIPTFLTVRDLGLYNTWSIMVIMNCVSVWNLMVARTYIQNSIPRELLEASMLDGAGHFQIFFKIILPLSKTIIAVLVVYYGVAKWNDYYTGLVYLKDTELLPLQTVLKDILASLNASASSFMEAMSEAALKEAEKAKRLAQMAKYCIIVVATGPVVVLYAFMQKYFEKGVMIGSLKG